MYKHNHVADNSLKQYAS